MVDNKVVKMTSPQLLTWPSLIEVSVHLSFSKSRMLELAPQAGDPNIVNSVTKCLLQSHNLLIQNYQHP
jgi:hypothetical protein